MKGLNKKGHSIQEKLGGFHAKEAMVAVISKHIGPK
jgi:hypothetical protein